MIGVFLATSVWCYNNNKNDNNNAAVSTAQNKLFSVALTAVQTNICLLVSQQNSAEKGTQSKC